MPNKKIVHVALADARGHLMRAHLLRELLAQIDVDVDIITTQEAGRSFLASLGTPSQVLPGCFRMELDDRHELKLGRTRRRFFRYALADMREDIDALRDLTRDAELVVNDSFHPVLLAAHHTLHRRAGRPPYPGGVRVVHLHGDNLKRTVTSTSKPFRVERWLSHAFAEIVHTLDPVERVDVQRVVGRRGRERSVVRLPPLVAAPRGVIRGERPIAAVYLNPHYRDPLIADLVEHVCAVNGLELRGVSEAFVGRPGWIATDARFIDVVASARVFISGAGMGALEQARVTGTPLVCLLGKQEEQTRNVIDRALPHVFVHDPCAREKLDAALRIHAVHEENTRRTNAIVEIERVRAMWTETFVTLLIGARDDEECRSRDRNQQLARWRRPRRSLAVETARASA